MCCCLAGSKASAFLRSAMGGEGIGRRCLGGTGGILLVATAAGSFAWTALTAISRRCGQPASRICVRSGVFAAALVVADVVAALAELEQLAVAARRLAGCCKYVLKSLTLALRGLVDADQLHLPGDPVAAVLKAEHRRHHHRGRHGLDLVAGDLANLLLVPLGVGACPPGCGTRTPCRR